MPGRFRCFGGNHTSDIEDEETDDESIDGYCALENVRESECATTALRTEANVANEEDGGYFRSPNSYQYYKSSSARTAGSNGQQLKDVPYTDVDVKGKRLRKKLKRRELKKRSRHVVHSTWKWFRRGLSSVLPGLSGMFIIFPAGAFVSASARQHAAAEAKNRKAETVGL